MNDLNKLRVNAEKIRSKGLDSEILKISEEVIELNKEKLKNKFGKTTIFYCKDILQNILGLYGENIKDLKILDLGCGDGYNYAPILAESLSSLGATVTGIDLGYVDKNKFGFNYLRKNILYECESIYEKQNSDVIIAKNLLNYGLRSSDAGPYLFFELEEEWERYKNMINNIKKKNENILYVLEKPNFSKFKRIKSQNKTTDEIKELEQNEVNSLIDKKILTLPYYLFGI